MTSFAGVEGKLFTRENRAGLVASGSDGAVDGMGGDFGSTVLVTGRNGSHAVVSVGGRSLSEVSEEGTAPNRGEREYHFWMAYLLPGSPYNCGS